MTPYKFVLHSKGLFVEASDAPEVLARLQYPKPVDGAEDHYRTWREVAASEHQRILSELVEKGEYVLHANESKQPILVGSGHHGSLMKREDLVRFYARVGIQLTIHEADPRQSDEAGTAGPVPAVAVPEPRPANAEPQPLTTGEIAFCFDGLRAWNENRWKSHLGDPPKWLAACIAIPGQRGVRETRWNPVCIGAALVDNGHQEWKTVRARFQTRPLLKPWEEAWKTYEADYSETE